MIRAGAAGRAAGVRRRGSLPVTAASDADRPDVPQASAEAPVTPARPGADPGGRA